MSTFLLYYFITFYHISIWSHFDKKKKIPATICDVVGTYISLHCVGYRPALRVSLVINSKYNKLLYTSFVPMRIRELCISDWVWGRKLPHWAYHQVFGIQFYFIIDHIIIYIVSLVFTIYVCILYIYIIKSVIMYWFKVK